MQLVCYQLQTIHSITEKVIKMNGNTHDDLNNRLYKSVQELKEIQDEKNDLKKEDPEKNAGRILELEYREEAKLEEINQIRDDKAQFEPSLEPSLSDKIHDFGQDVKEKLNDLGEGLKEKFGALQEKIEEVSDKALGATAAIAVGVASQTAVISDDKNVQDISKNVVEIAQDYTERKEKSEPEKEPEKDLEKGDDKHTQSVESNKEDIKTLMVDYQKDYFKELRQSGSYEQAAEKATDKLIDKLESQKDPNEKDKNNEKEDKNEKAAELIKAQYGDKGKEEFDNVKEKEKQKEQEREKEQEKAQNQDKSR